MRTHRLFVYGLLKRGEVLHEPYLKQAEFLGEDTINGLHEIAEYPKHRLHLGQGVVKGEVYAIDDRTLANIDRCEGHPWLYERREVQLNALGGTAWAYYFNQ